jgi:UDP-N-acetylmuramoyl-L-alanyl-D-glutamate--2,6-diaminopimelate ligase
MKLGDLVRGAPGERVGVDLLGQEITSLAYDSRRAKPGSLFFAIRGEKADGYDFVGQALAAGAVALVSERPAPPEHSGRWVRVEHARRALAEASQVFYGDPASRLQLVGITGTNGKTTTAFLLHSILEAAGMRPGLFGTVEYRVAGRTLPAIHTTPESADLLSYFADLVAAGAKAAIMEVSSHALAQERVWGIHFQAAVFTNLSRDHLDYHKDLESYFAAKRRLFEGVGAPPPELAVLNLDDPWSERLLELPRKRHVTYGISSDAQVKVMNSTQSLTGLRAALMTPRGKLEIESPLIGRANLQNILAAVATAEALGLPEQTVRQGIADLKSVPGRFERVSEGQPFLVVVDYAHTDDALRNALETARELTRSRLIVVFGCGGDRDRAKRPLMGEVAGYLSDLAVLTSDNPRTEDPIRIMNDAIVGLQKANKPYLTEVDRRAAIRKALAEAGEGDVVLIAGKGHETHQMLKDQIIPFDDREVARQVLREMGREGSKKNTP